MSVIDAGWVVDLRETRSGCHFAVGKAAGKEKPTNVESKDCWTRKKSEDRTNTSISLHLFPQGANRIDPSTVWHRAVPYGVKRNRTRGARRGLSGSLGCGSVSKVCLPIQRRALVSSREHYGRE
jgi:hypothetical protein